MFEDLIVALIDLDLVPNGSRSLKNLLLVISAASALTLTILLHVTFLKPLNTALNNWTIWQSPHVALALWQCCAVRIQPSENCHHQEVKEKLFWRRWQNIEHLKRLSHVSLCSKNTNPYSCRRCDLRSFRLRGVWSPHHFQICDGRHSEIWHRWEKKFRKRRVMTFWSKCLKFVWSLGWYFRTCFSFSRTDLWLGHLVRWLWFWIQVQWSQARVLDGLETSRNFESCESVNGKWYNNISQYITIYHNTTCVWHGFSCLLIYLDASSHWKSCCDRSWTPSWDKLRSLCPESLQLTWREKRLVMGQV